MSTTMILLNLALSAFAVLGVFALVALAHRLPTRAPRTDRRWGRGGDPWVASDPLPLVELASYERRRALDRAA
jgi:hypothetical protein